MRRQALGRDYSQEMFTRNALRTHPKNLMPLTGPNGPMRGGIRL